MIIFNRFLFADMITSPTWQITGRFIFEFDSFGNVANIVDADIVLGTKWPQCLEGEVAIGPAVSVDFILFWVSIQNGAC